MRHLGDLSATPKGRGVELSCEACQVTWTGCADVHECPECGDPKYWFESQMPDGLYMALYKEGMLDSQQEKRIWVF